MCECVVKCVCVCVCELVSVNMQSHCAIPVMYEGGVQFIAQQP